MANVGTMIEQFDEDLRGLLEHEFSFKDNHNRVVLQPLEEFKERIPKQPADWKEVPPELDNWNKVTFDHLHCLAPRYPNNPYEVQAFVKQRLQMLDNLL